MDLPLLLTTSGGGALAFPHPSGTIPLGKDWGIPYPRIGFSPILNQSWPTYTRKRMVKYVSKQSIQI